MAPFDTPYQTPPFHAIRLEHYEPAFHAAISQARQEIENIAANPEPPTFANTIEALDSAGERLDTISSIFFNLNSACTSGEMQQIYSDSDSGFTFKEVNGYMYIFSGQEMLIYEPEFENAYTVHTLGTDEYFRGFLHVGDAFYLCYINAAGENILILLQ